MNTVTLFKSLQDIFTLPALPAKKGTTLNEWTWVGTNIELQVFLVDQDDDYVYTRQVDIQDFRAHCELTNEIDGSFCEWFERLSWFDQKVEAESYADRWISDIQADYEQWKANRKAI